MTQQTAFVHIFKTQILPCVFIMKRKCLFRICVYEALGLTFVGYSGQN